jgi:hypothetical protein
LPVDYDYYPAVKKEVLLFKIGLVSVSEFGSTAYYFEVDALRNAVFVDYDFCSDYP